MRRTVAILVTGLALWGCTESDGGDGETDTIRVAADMIVDGDTVRRDGPNVRLTGAGDVPYDTPETYRPECDYETRLGAEATDLVQSLMPGELRIIQPGGGGYGRDLGVLYGRDGDDVRQALMAAGLARASTNFDWCGEAAR